MAAAASGMAAQQSSLDVVTDNLANADVPGFKGSVAVFAPLGSPAQGSLGTQMLGAQPVFTQGKLMKTGGPFDVALDGPGFLAVEKDGVTGYTRAGSFARGADGAMRDAAGWKLHGVRVPADALALDVRADGAVYADTREAKGRALGRISLASFAAPDALRGVDATHYTATAESGPAQRLRAGGDGETHVAFGMLEKSNVSIVESMMQILGAQRAYEANAKGVQAADEMLRIANNIHRG